MAKLTYQQKLEALSYRFYQSGQWAPKAGDFYTTSRADLEVYQVVSVEGNIVRTRFTEGSDAISEWPEAGFLTEGFGPRRVYVPEWVMNAAPIPLGKVDDERLEDLRLAAKAIRLYMPETLPAGEDGKIHFARALAEAAAASIEAVLAPSPSPRERGIAPVENQDIGEKE